MEKLDYKNIFINDIIGVYGISAKNFFSKVQLSENNISYISSNNFEFCTNTFKSEIQLNINLQNIDKKTKINNLSEYVKLFDLEEDIFNRKINCLSSSEKYILYIILNLLYESKIYVFEDVYNCLDKVNKKKILELFKRLKMLGKTVIIMDNINVLYHLTSEVYLFKENNVVFSAKTKEILTDVEKLIRKGFDVPELPLITYLAKKKKGVKLFYHDDVRDIIKDVYKHV